jgi:ABC-type cobalt transport system substrate-binding protein
MNKLLIKLLVVIIFIIILYLLFAFFFVSIDFANWDIGGSDSLAEDWCILD